MKTPDDWVRENSQSGAFDLVGSCAEATELVRRIQADALRGAAEEVETHWNDAAAIAIQKQQATRSAVVLRDIAEKVATGQAYALGTNYTPAKEASPS